MVVALASLVFLSGCFSGTTSTVPQTETPSIGTEASGSTDSLQVPEPPPLPPRIVPVQYEGTVGASVCLPSGPNACEGTGVPFDGQENNPYALEEPVVVRAVDLTLTWDSLTPSTERLSLIIGQSEGNAFLGVASVTGSSPLSLTLDDVEWGDEPRQVGFYVHVPSSSPPPVVLIASLPQDFSVTGELTLAPATA